MRSALQPICNPWCQRHGSACAAPGCIDPSQKRKLAETTYEFPVHLAFADAEELDADC